MVIVHLYGGLGNQLFQYAFGRYLASKAHCPLKLDARAYEKDKSRAFALDHFALPVTKANDADILRVEKPARNRFTGWLQERRPYFRRRRVVEPHFHFDPNLLRLRAPVYVLGYFQSVKYFEPIADLLRSELSPKTPPGEFYQAQLSDYEHLRAKGFTPVSLLVRRGDYLTTPKYCVLDNDYYQRAERELRKVVAKPFFKVFTDDPEWVRKEFRLESPWELVEAPEKKDFEDLRLMSQCDHHVIGNSTFAWWGAWLGHNPEKKVIAPQRWFQVPELNSQDLIPEGWIRL